MFQRFTGPARQVVIFAQDEARVLRHNYVGIEHILLGLLREERGLAERVLVSLGVTLDETRARVRAHKGEGPLGEPLTGQIPFWPKAKKALELALREALTLNHKYLGTEHLLLGLVAAGDSVALTILEEQGAGAERIREELMRLIGGSGPQGPPVDSPA